MRGAFDKRDLPARQARRQVLLYLDNTLFCHDRDPYRLLGLTPDCTFEDIRRRHKQMLQVFHPDRHPGEQDWFTDRSERLNRAYAYLKTNHGKPGSTSIPTATTVAGAPSTRPAASRPKKARPRPHPPFPDKAHLRRRLKTWLGNPANLQQRLYMVLVAVPVLLLGLLYLNNTGRFDQAASTVVTDITDEAGEADAAAGDAMGTAAANRAAIDPERYARARAAAPAMAGDATAAATRAPESDHPEATGPADEEDAPGQPRAADNAGDRAQTTVAAAAEAPDNDVSEPGAAHTPDTSPAPADTDADTDPDTADPADDGARQPEPRRITSPPADTELTHPDRLPARPTPLSAMPEAGENPAPAAGIDPAPGSAPTVADAEPAQAEADAQSETAVTAEPDADAPAETAVAAEPDADAPAETAVTAEPDADTQAEPAVTAEPNADTQAETAVTAEPNADAQPETEDALDELDPATPRTADADPAPDTTKDAATDTAGQPPTETTAEQPSTPDEPAGESQADTSVASAAPGPDQPQTPDAEPQPTVQDRAATSPTPNPAPQTPISAIQSLLESYQSTYNGSDLDAFTNLFGDDARTKNAASKSEIRQKYGDLFRKTRDRHLVLDDVRIKILGERQYQVKTKYSVDWTYPDGKTNSSTGRFDIHLVTVDGELKIWRLDY